MTIDEWLTALDERHLSELTPSEVTRALRALSSCYVERREKLASGGALDGAGKRAAFALFYGPQHFFVTREIVRSLRATPLRRDFETPPDPRVPADGGSHVVRKVLDLGCGTGTAGAAAALEIGARSIDGFDLNAWAVREANWTYRALGLRGRATVANLTRVKLPPAPGTLVLAAYAVNELPEDARDPMLARLLDAQHHGASVLVIEPIGRRVNRWWDRWAHAFLGQGGGEHEWRLRVSLPARQRDLARAAGLDVQELTARSLFLPSPDLSE